MYVISVNKRDISLLIVTIQGRKVRVLFAGRWIIKQEIARGRRSSVKRRNKDRANVVDKSLFSIVDNVYVGVYVYGVISACI